MTLFRILIVVFDLLIAAGPLRAQTAAPPALPPGFTQQQFDGLVEAISRSVAQKLKDEQAAAKPAPQAPPAAPAAAAEPSDEYPVAAEVARFIDRAEIVVMAFPELLRTYAQVPAAIDRSAEGGPGLLLFLLMVVFSVAAALGAERIVDLALAGVRARAVAKSNPSRGAASLPPLLWLALLDAAGLAAIWLVANALTGAWFSGADPQSRLGAAILTAVFSWRLYMFAFRLVLRPRTPDARLAPVGDAGAASIYARISTIVIAVITVRVVLRIAIALKASHEAVGSGQLIANAVLLYVFLWASYASREPVAEWFTTISSNSSVGRALGRRWLVIAVPFFCVLIAAQIYGAVSARVTIPAAMLLTLNTVLGVILLRTLIYAVTLRVGHAGQTGAARSMTVFDLIGRCVNVAMLIGAGVLIAQTWIVDVFALVDSNGWRALAKSSVTGGVTLFLAYVGVELVSFFTKRYGVQQSAPGGPPAEEDEHGATATRLATMMPLARLAMLIVICTTALLIVLSEWGVNITPLIAGASVFGLALSFGSQTLVKDVVSGIFYLADDAFRVGEYIDCGKAKGTVEGFTLRSIRLRHQNGQVHTIPFGQLGQITNFSRDWTTVKFNLRFARDTDVEKLRKTVKKIGAEMQEEPELKNEFLEPLKMQGVADITDNALIIRFKFTVKPGKPSFIQRESVKRMVRAFPALGIEFANATVSVQTYGGHTDEKAAGAAVQSTLQRIQAEAAATTA
jgi:small-conductance mechanosensitive channel